MDVDFADHFERLRDLDRRYFLGFYFVFVTALMLWQQTQGWAWDFSVYSLNAEYLFHDGVYMEWKRPPLLPTILGVLQYIFSMRAAENVFVLLCSGFSLYSMLKVSESYDLDPLRLYVMVMSPFVVLYSVLQGTELLFLSLMAMFVADLDDGRAGVWLGLAFLTRYTGGLFGVLLLFQKDFRKMLYSGVAGFFTVLPWLVFNYFALGHPFASIADSYALDVVERTLTTPFNLEDPFLITGIAVPFALYYLWDQYWDFELVDVMMVLMSALIIFRQLGTHIKVRRYLFDLALPVAFLAVKGLDNLERSKKIFYAIFTLYLISTASLFVVERGNGFVNPGDFQDASDEVGNCKTVSNIWPFLSYAGTPSGPLETHFKSEQEFIEEGYKIVKFGNGTYSVKGDGCVKEPYNVTYIQKLDKYDGGARICRYVPFKTCKLEEKLFGGS